MNFEIIKVERSKTTSALRLTITNEELPEPYTFTITSNQVKKLAQILHEAEGYISNPFETFESE